MPITRRTPEVNSIIANRLRSIDAFGQPQGDEAMDEAKHFVHYGWVRSDEWSLTDAGRAALKVYQDKRATAIKERDDKSERARMTAR